ncbi:MAG: ribonuclease P protein component [Anaerorhabdus sp.]
MKKEWRVKSQQEFQSLISKKQSLSNKAFVLYFQPKQMSNARFGVSVGKKLGNAVYRNKWKRQLRMLLQETVDFDNFPVDGVIIVRQPFTTQSFEENKKCLESLLNKVYNKDIK